MGTTPMTSAVRALHEAGVTFQTHLYRYTGGLGAEGAARVLGLDPHAVIKTLIMETGQGNPLCVLMHADQKVSTKGLARRIGTKSIRTSPPDRAERYSGYRVGGTSPFGMRTTMPVYLESTVLNCSSIYVNGGKRGFLVEISPHDLVSILQPILVEMAA